MEQTVYNKQWIYEELAYKAERKVSHARIQT